MENCQNPFINETVLWLEVQRYSHLVNTQNSYSMTPPPYLLSVTTIFTYFSCELVIGGLILLNVACKHTMSCTYRLVKS